MAVRKQGHKKLKETMLGFYFFTWYFSLFSLSFIICSPYMESIQPSADW
jgi:hypothetical protein